MATMKSFFAIVVTAMATALGTTPVRAADFTFRIPLAIQNLDEEIISANIRCDVYGNSASTANFEGANDVTLTLDWRNSGNVSETLVEIPVTVLHRDLRDLGYYKCVLRVFPRGGAGAPMNVTCSTQSFTTNTTVGTTREVLVADPTKPCNGVVEGEIPRP